MQHAGFHHAKMLDQLCTTINTQGTEMITMIQELVVTDNNSSIEENLPPTAPPAPAANAAAHMDVQLEIICILQEMQQNNAG